MNMSSDNRSYVEEKNFEHDEGSLENEERQVHQNNDEMVVLDMEEDRISASNKPFTTGPKSQVAYEFDHPMKLNFDAGVFNLE